MKKKLNAVIGCCIFTALALVLYSLISKPDSSVSLYLTLVETALAVVTAYAMSKIDKYNRENIPNKQ